MDQAAQMRERVLDAAEQCLLEGGFGDSRLHSAIARRAGLSRPTVYKYVGDQDTINAAVIQRHLIRFLSELQPLLDRRRPLREQLLDVLVFVVQHAREHPLLRAALRDVPEQLLPWFTTRANVLVAQVEPVVMPSLLRYAERGALAVDPRLLVDALSRVALSLVFTTGLVELATPEAVRDYLAAFVDIALGTRVPARQY